MVLAGQHDSQTEQDSIGKAGYKAKKVKPKIDSTIGFEPRKKWRTEAGATDWAVDWDVAVSIKVHMDESPRLCSQFSSVQLLSCVPLFATSGFPVHHQLPELTQTHVHLVSDAIQPSHPLSSPSPAFHLSQHQGLFKWGDFLHQVAKGLEFQLQHQSF